jgi:hypothetical protein
MYGEARRLNCICMEGDNYGTLSAQSVQYLAVDCIAAACFYGTQTGPEVHAPSYTMGKEVKLSPATRRGGLFHVRYEHHLHIRVKLSPVTGRGSLCFL